MSQNQRILFMQFLVHHADWLAPKDRMIAIMHACALTNKEIAQSRGLTLAEVRLIIRRIRRKLDRINKKSAEMAEDASIESLTGYLEKRSKDS